VDRALEQLEGAGTFRRSSTRGLDRREDRRPERVDVQVGSVGRVDSHCEHAFRVQRVDGVARTLGILREGDQRDARVAVVVVSTPEGQPRETAHLGTQPGMVPAHPLEQRVETGELHPRHRTGQLGRAEVVARELRQPHPAPHRVGAVVHVQRDIEQIVAIRDHDAAFAGGDDLVELQAEGARVTERAEPPPAERRACRLADVLDQREVVAFRDRRQRIHVGRRAAHVHRNDGARP